MKINQTLKSSSILMLVAMIWGFAFVGQRAATEYLGPFFFTGARMLLGALTLAIVLYIQYLRAKRKLGGDITKKSFGEWFADNKLLLKAGISCGAVLFIGTTMQQIGLVFTTASKAGFLTTLYVVIVPILSILLKKKTHWNTWISVGIAVVGLYFLTVTESLSMEVGDTILVVSALFWAGHIMVIDYFAPKVNVVKMSMIQFAFVSVLGFILAPFFDHYFVASLTLDKFVDAIPSLLWVGVLSSGVAFTLQAVGQKGANPTAVAIILSLESVFGLIGGFLILGEAFTSKEWIGSILMFAAVILAQLPLGTRKTGNNEDTQTKQE